MRVLWYYAASSSFLVEAGQRPSLFTNETFISHRQNFCPLHSLVESSTINRRDVFKGTQLNVALFRYQINKETGAINDNSMGMGIRIMDELAKRAGFTWRDSYGTIESPSGNKTWDSVMIEGISSYDILGDWYLRVPSRLANGIVFPEGWYDGSLIMVRKVGKMTDKFHFLSFFKPFSWYVWLVTLLTIFFSAVFYFLIDQMDSRVKNRNLEASLKDDIFRASFYLTGHFEQQPQSSSTKLIAFSMGFMFFMESHGFCICF